MGRFLQSDDEEEEEVRPQKGGRPATAPQQSAKAGVSQNTKLALLPETVDEEAEQWISTGPVDAPSRYEKRGGRNHAPRRPPPPPAPVPPSKPLEAASPPPADTTPAPVPAEPAERRRPRDNGGQRPKREKAPKPAESLYVRKV